MLLLRRGCERGLVALKKKWSDDVRSPATSEASSTPKWTEQVTGHGEHQVISEFYFKLAIKFSSALSTSPLKLFSLSTSQPASLTNV